MYQLYVYPITANLWRWEVRNGDVLLRCGTASSQVEAELNANGVFNR
jgi:hypothetical protein